MNKLSAQLPGLVLHLLLLPLLLLWVPLMFAMAWIREALSDLRHPMQLRPLPLALCPHDRALALLHHRPGG